MGTLIKKVTSDSAYLWLKTFKSGIYISGFPKRHVRVTISQKAHSGTVQDAPHFEAFWTPD